MELRLSEKTVIVLSPHTDDAEFGMGGTISKMIQQGASVYNVAFSIAEESVPDGFPADILRTEIEEASKKLGLPQSNLVVYTWPVRRLMHYRQEILEQMVTLKKTYNPDIVFMPSVRDVHQDHRAIADEGLRAFKDTSIFAYEVPWNNFSFHNQAFSVLSDVDLSNKIWACLEYKSQSFRSYIGRENITAQAIYRGTQVKVKYAEVFEVVRLLF